MPWLVKDPWMLVFQFTYSTVETAILLTSGILMSSVRKFIFCSQPCSAPPLLCFILFLKCSRFILPGFKSSRICTFHATWAVAETWPVAWLHSEEGPKGLATLWRELWAIFHVSPIIRLHLAHSLVPFGTKLDRSTELNCTPLVDAIVCSLYFEPFYIVSFLEHLLRKTYSW